MNQRRDRRQTDTQERILQEAEALYLEGGYEQINQQVIANRLHITKAALFYHFASKQELFFQMLLFMLERTHRTISEAIADEQLPVRERLQRLMEALLAQPTFDVTRFGSEELHLLTSEQQWQVGQAVERQLLGVVERMFAAGVAQGELRAHDTHMSSLLFLQMCVPLSHPRSPVRIQMNRQQREVENRKLLDLFFYGVASTKES